MAELSTVPKLVRDSLKREGAYDFGLGVVLRAPKDPGGRGGSASYRIDHRVEPLLPGRPAPRRRQVYRRDLEGAYTRASELFEEMQERASGRYIEYYTDVLFGDVVELWYASPHPRWGERYPTKVRTLLRNWVLADHVTVRRGAAGRHTALADVPIGALTADHYNQALEHVHSSRAYRTYTEVHGLVVQIIKWALANRYLRPEHGLIVEQLPMAPSDDGQSDVGVRAIPPEEIPPVDKLDKLVDTARRLHDQRLATQIYLLAFVGLRISECLALRNDDRFQRGEDGCWRIHVREQVHRDHRRVMPPKWRKRRWAFVPHFLTDEVQALLHDTESGALLFPSPGRPERQPDGTIVRVGAGLHPYGNWHERIWTRVAQETPEWPEREDWWPADAGPVLDGKQQQKRWQWPVHSLRHLCATYQLNVMRLDPDDVAKFLGHRSGVQVWEMYVRVRPNLFGRAGDASRAAGDPRARSDG